MDKAEIVYDKKDSITLKRNAKGEYAWDIKVYYDCVEESDVDVVDNIMHTDGLLRETFLESDGVPT